MALLAPSVPLPQDIPYSDVATQLADSGVPSWAVALLIWSSAMVLLAVATFRAGQILLRVMPEAKQDDVDREQQTPVP